jgi:quercetin dioxygenase-like cupin family protein
VNDRPEHAVRILFSHELLDVTWSHFGPVEPGAVPHVHREHTDAFYVLEGELAFQIGPDLRRVSALAGTFVAVPPNVIHGFGSGSRERTTFLNFHAPNGGFADYMRGVTQGFDSFDPPLDGGEPAATAIVSPTGEGERLERRTPTLVKAQLPHLAVIEFVFGPGWEVDPHAHDDHVDAFFVLEGEAQFLGGIGDPGAFIAAPPGAVHGFRILDRAPTTLLNIHAPDTGFTDRLRQE